MNKLLTSVGLAIGLATATLIAGCNLYFDDKHHSSGDDSPGGSVGSGGQPPGYACTSDKQCAAGCFCAEGTCEEGGFCGTDADCGDGFHCDTSRASCVPDGSCKQDSDCDQGSICDSATGGCTATCKCLTDAEAVAQGAGFCDEARETCMPGSDPDGTCQGAVTCATAAPRCGEHQVPTVANGCYTGACSDITACAGAPTCELIQHQDDCAARTADCGVVSIGHDCTKPDGSACSVGDTDCTCASFTYGSCETKGPGAGPSVIYQ